MGRIAIRPPADFWAMTEDEQLAWCGALLAEVLADYDAEPDA